MKNHLLLLLTLVLIASCGKDDSKSSSKTNLNVELNAKLNTFVGNSGLDPKTPEGVGALFNISSGDKYSNKIYACTWFLIGKDYAMTNSHCIPDVLKNNKDIDCSKYLQGRISKGNGEYETRACSKVVSSSEINNKTVLGKDDYAVIKLSSSINNITPLKFSRAGLSDSEYVEIHTMNHSMTTDFLYSEYKQHKCIVQSSDILGSIKHKGSSPLTVFQEKGTSDFCRTINGNSGSPVLNNRGEVIAVLHGGISEGKSLSNIGLLSKNNITDSIGVITNLRCAKTGIQELDFSITKECSRSDKKEIVTRLQSKLSKQYVKNITIARNSMSKIFMYEYKMKNIGQAINIAYFPKCILPKEKWNKEELDNIEEKGLIFKRESIKATANTFYFLTEYSADYYGNFDISMSFRPTLSVNYTIVNLKKLEDDKKVKAKYTQVLLGTKFDRSIDIPVCSENEKNWTEKK